MSFYKKPSNYKSISVRIKDEALEEQLETHISYKLIMPRGNVFYNRTRNPQDVIRELLAEHGFIRKKGADMSMGERSDWEPGQSIKVSFYREDADHFRHKAEELGVKVQEVITTLLREFFQLNPPVLEEKVWEAPKFA